MARPEGAFRHFLRAGHWPRWEDFGGFPYCTRCTRGRYIRSLAPTRG